MKKQFIKLSVLVALALSTSCTNLKEGVYNTAVADQFYSTPGGAQAALADIYKEIRGDWNGVGIAGADRGWFDLNEACTDEMMIPRRSDGAWEDNGIWKQMYMHTWTSGQPFIENTWNWLYKAVFKANLAIELLTKSNADPAYIAEAKVLRAYFHYLLMDGWGGVPILTSSQTLVKDVKQYSRQEVYNFVVEELKANIDKLPAPSNAQKSGEFYNRFHRWAGYMVLAKVYMNAEVYTGTAKWTEATAACNKIIDEGGYSLVSASNYFNQGNLGLFGDACNTSEVIFGISVDATKLPRNIIGVRSLYGPDGNARFGFSCWNGATVHQDFVNKYDNADIRKAQWLVGQQVGANYDLNISSFDNAAPQAGARNAKFLPVPPYNSNSASNDFPAYRFADVILMKAEALFRAGDAAGATVELDKIRNRAGLPNLPVALTLDEIYDERGRELCWEGHRRQDMIRFDKFLAAHDFKATVSPATYKLFPVPASALAANPTGLKQNAGY